MKQKLKKISVSIPKIILCILKETGSITCESFFHNSHAGKFGFGHGPRFRHNYYNSIHRLQKKGFVKKEKDTYKLTAAGEREAFFSLTKIGRHFRSENQKWDKKWRMVFFDIPEIKRRYRDELRFVLKRTGFKEFQKSAWVCPYEIPQFFKKILLEENIRRYVRLITINDIEYDKDLKTMFNLK